MKNYQRVLSFLIIKLITINYVNAQSTSVFDANYFNTDNMAPPIKIGKGFHINDIYKQTRSCFTNQTANPNKLTAQQVGGKKTSIRLFYTKTNKQFNSLKTQGHSGKVSFLNLFSVGGKKLEEYSNKVIKNEERLIFKAIVDFGLHSFEKDPELTSEAKSLIEQKQLESFVKMYGTHYISGIRKESSIKIILTKNTESYQTGKKESGVTNIGANIPYKGSGSLEVENGNWVNQELSNNEFSVSIEIQGPSLNKNDIQGKVKAILTGNSQDKSDAISSIIEGVLENISDPTQGHISQFYYSPFSLYGLDGIYWDEKKQNTLAKINEAIIDVYSAKTETEEVISGSGKQQLINEFEKAGVNNEYTSRVVKKYNKMLPVMRRLNSSANKYLKELETIYKKCSDIFCQNTSTCCNNEKFILEIQDFNFDGQIEKEENKVIRFIEEIAKEINTPECEKNGQGVITIQNLSYNPYNLYQGDSFIETISGKTNKSFNVALGTYYFKAVQKSGYMMYPTKNSRSATITTICQEVILQIGFED